MTDSLVFEGEGCHSTRESSQVPVEREVGEGLPSGLDTGGIAREDIFVATKLWNTNHRSERVEPAFEASLDRLGLNYLDLYLSHTPFAFQPGGEPDPRDQGGNVLYDRGVSLLETWRAIESLVNRGKCQAIGLSDVSWDGLIPIYESAWIKAACSWLLRHWVTESDRGRSMIRSLW
jgi:alcohol dehydrogenase (NADP+)